MRLNLHVLTAFAALRAAAVHRMVVAVVVAVVVVVAVGGVVFLAGGIAHADTAPVTPAASLDAVFTNIRNWAMGILAGLATAFLTLGGVRYMLAGNDPGEVEKAKSAFKTAGIGFGLAVLAPIVVTVLEKFVGA